MLKRVVILTLLMIWCNLNAQFNVSKPTFGFTQVCASASFNNFPVSFSVASIASQGTGNEFVVELSDSNGSFLTPTVLKQFTAVTSPVNTSVVFPTNVYGAGYKIRIKSTNPVKTGLPNDVGFSAYYAVYNQSFTINNGQSAVKLCNGQSVTLSIDSGANSPLQYPQLNYVWYKDGAVITGEIGPSLTVSQQGQYYAEVNYGSCTTSYNAYSNLVAVSNGDLTPQIQTSDSSLSICENGSKQIICSEQNAAYAYKWYKDGVLISGTTNYNYNATMPGTYKVVVVNGGCSFSSNDITLVSTIVNANILPLASYTIIPGQQIVLTTSTNAVQPTYTWYKDTVLINGQTGSTLTITKNGVYKVAVKQNQGCLIEKSSEIVVSYPTGFDTSVKNTIVSASCQSTTASLSLDKFSALTTSGPINILGNNYGYAYQWYKDGVAVSGAIATTLNLSGALSNGTYKIGITIPDFGEIFSNTVDVQMKISEDITITNNSPLCTNGDTVVLQSKLTDSNYTYDWYFNGTKIASNNTGNCIVTQAGNYYLVVKSGLCSIQSNTINLQESNFNLSFSSSPSLIIPGQQLTLTVSTDALQPTYTWYKDTVLINGQTGSTLTITKNGVYKVEVKQNQGCLKVKNSEIIVSYPTGFDLSIKNAIASASCQSTSASLSLDKFSALTTPGPVNILGNNYGYAYQWYKDGAAVSGAIATTLNLAGALSNGVYKIGITIPDFGEIFSNVIDVQMKISEDITITNNSPLCTNGDTVVLQSKLTDSNYTYDWYFNGTKIASNNTGNCTVTQAGNYYLVVKSGLCSIQSNTINLQESNFNLSYSSSPSLIIPGQQLTLTVSTDALQPTYTWYKDTVLINGQTGSTLTITKNGVYKVAVKQNQGCLVEKSSEIVVSYPTGFDLGIKNTMAYTQCQSTSASLSLDKFSALTTPGPVSILGNNYGYAYQWYKDGATVSGATATTLNLSGALSNGAYKIGVTIPDFGEIFSNTVDVQLKISEDITIANNSPLCANGDTVVLQSKLTDSNYIYDWYFNGTKIASNNTGNCTVTQAGNYYLVVKNGVCSLQSNTINLQESNFNLSFSSSPAFIIPGQQLTLTVSTDALQPTYTWYKDNVLINGQTGNTLAITKNGTYKVAVKQVQGCLIEKSSEIVISYPIGFDLSVKNTMASAQCQSTSASLSLDKFSALTPSTPIDISGNTYGYTYQWYKDGIVVSGATATALNLLGAVSNGIYKLGVTIPDFGEIFSNTVDVQLKISEDITITNNSPFCSNGDTVVLQSKLTNSNYTYDWYFNGTKILTNNTGNCTVTLAGNYYLVVKSGLCSLQSNTINLQEPNFNLSFSSSSTLIVPGQQLTLTAVADAFQPTYTWYKDNILINGQTDSVLTITKNGVYKVVVKQNQGCFVEKSTEIVVSYPTGFDLTVKNTMASAQCQSTTASLSLDKFSALTTSAPVDISGNNYGYTYQWYKDGVAVSGATVIILNLSGAVSNGVYKLGVTIPDFGEIFSNTVDVQLKITEDVSIASNGSFCKNGDAVILQSALNNSTYVYDWYYNGTKIVTNDTASHSVDQAGNYYLVVKSGACSLQSNTINLKAAAFNVSISSQTSIIIPGQTTILTVATDALQPSFVWYKNGVLIGGQNTNTFQISDPGVYKVVVSQTQGCVLDNSSEITIENPSDFTITITPAVGYQECKSTATTLKLDKLIANSTSGKIDLTNNPYNYTFQWYKNNMAIPGEVSPVLSITGFAENAAYKLQVIIPGFTNVNSNMVDVLLGLTNQVKITQSGIFCDEGSEVTLNSNYADTSFTYEWFESSSNNVIGNSSMVTVDKSGNYYLKVSSNGCGLASNVISILPYSFSQVTVDAPEKFGIVEGGSRTVTASGADSYQWYFNNQLVSQGNMYKITELGTYNLIVKVGNCEKTYIFEAEHLENTYVLSNTVTPNGDGFNDYWSIPMDYAYKDNVLVTIIDGSGNIVFRTSNYQNNWPEGNLQYSQTAPVYYFTIEEMAGGMLKSGSITMVK